MKLVLHFSLKCLFLKLERAPQSQRTEFSVKVYGFLAKKYSTRNPRVHKQQKKRERHMRALKKVKQLKNEARRDFRRSKELPIESI